MRLTANGTQYTQPLALHYDPRLKTSAAGLGQLTSLTTEMYFGAVAARDAATKARALVAELDSLKGDDIVAFKAKVAALVSGQGGAGGGGAPGGGRGGGGRGGARGGAGGGAAGGAPAAAPTFDAVSTAMFGAATAMQSADVKPTGNQVAACDRARAESATVMSSWTKLTTLDLPALNTKRKAAGLPVVVVPK